MLPAYIIFLTRKPYTKPTLKKNEIHRYIYKPPPPPLPILPSNPFSLTPPGRGGLGPRRIAMQRVDRGVQRRRDRDADGIGSQPEVPGREEAHLDRCLEEGRAGVQQRRPR